MRNFNFKPLFIVRFESVLYAPIHLPAVIFIPMIEANLKDMEVVASLKVVKQSNLSRIINQGTHALNKLVQSIEI